MLLLSLAVLSVLCTLNEAITFHTVATVSLTLISLNQPVSCFFGFFRRRKSPVQETIAPQEMQNPFQFPNQMPSGFNPFGFQGGAGGFFPGFGGQGFGALPGLGMFNRPPSNRFPPQFVPPRQNVPQNKVPQREVPGDMMQQMAEQSQNFPAFSDMNDMNSREPKEGPGMNTEEAESFFTLLSETDESKCISRLVCEMGANPDSGGEFGQTIVEIIGSLNDFPDGSKVSEYNEILNLGMAEGLSACLSKFSICDEESFQLVKKAQMDNDE